MTYSFSTKPGAGRSETIPTTRDLTGYTLTAEFSVDSSFSSVTTKSVTGSGRSVSLVLTAAEVDSLKDTHYRIKAVKGGVTSYIQSGVIDRNDSKTPGEVMAADPAVRASFVSGFVYDVGTDTYVRGESRTFYGPHDPATKGIAGFDSSVDLWFDSDEQPWGPGMAPTFQSGLWSLPPHTARATGTPAVGALRVTPFWVTRPVTLNALGCEITVAAAGAVVRLGIYDGFDEGDPLLAEGTTVDGGVVAAWSTSVLPAPLALAPGLYSIMSLSTVAAPTMRSISTAGYLAPTSAPGGTSVASGGRTSLVNNFSSLPANLPTLQPAGLTLLGVRAA